MGISPSCYGGKASLDLIADSWKGSQSVVTRRTQKVKSFKEFQQWVGEIPSSNERDSWAVGGMVLTAGLLFVSKRSHHQRQRQSASLCAATAATRRLEVKMKLQSPGSPGNRKGNGR